MTIAHPAVRVAEIAFSTFFLTEFILYLTLKGSSILLEKQLKTFLALTNLSVFVMSCYLLVKWHNGVDNAVAVLAIVRLFRLINILRLLPKFNIMLNTISAIKSLILPSLFGLQISFFYLFSCGMVFLIGGKIKAGQYDHIDNGHFVSSS